MLMWANGLFYVVFLGQIFLISYYVPRKVLARMRYVLDTYPPSEYPKLYPKPVEHYRFGQGIYRLINRIVFALGFVILFAVLKVDQASFADDGFVSEAWPAFYGMIQFLPLMLLELSEFGHLKQMRQANLTTHRRAELRPRRFFDHVSPVTVSLAVLLYIAAVAADLYSHGFSRPWSLWVWLTLGNLFMAGAGAWGLYGRKLNPHQSFEDRAQYLSVNLTSLLHVSMVMSVFFLMAAADQVFDLDYLDAPLLSLCFQAIVLLSIGHILRLLRPEDLDFDVYKDDAVVTTAS